MSHGFVRRAFSSVQTRDLVQLSDGRPIFLASQFNPDGVSGKTASFFDAADRNHLLVQATDANQVALPAAHADFGGKVCATATGGEAYQSNRSTTFWSFTSNGQGCEVLHIFTPLAGAGTRVMGATTFAGASTGFQFYWVAGGDLTASLNRTGGGSQDVMTPQSIGAVGQDAPTYAWMRFQSSAGNDFELRRKGALVASGVFSNAPNPGVTGAAYTLFSNGYPAPSLGATCRWYGTMFFPALSQRERDIVQTFVNQETGIKP